MTKENRLYRKSNGNFTKGFNTQINVTSALIYRELKTRVSEVKFGVLGVFIEPLGVMIVFLTIFSLLRGRNNTIDIVLFLGSGIVLYTLFNEVAIRSLNAMKANEALFFYRPVKSKAFFILSKMVCRRKFGEKYRNRSLYPDFLFVE